MSNSFNKSKTNYETLAKKRKLNDNLSKVTIEEIAEFHEKYIALMFENLETHDNRKKALEEIE
ncbi:hypothetical protein K9F06_12730 [Staphylococcus pseudintermedius]|nr:hypothetical protein K9F06_12730 [Staphylococcus pseudintermedius]